MAYTEPRTWSDGELVNASIMNGHVRDNFRAIGPHFRILKSADQSITSNATLQNDTVFTFPVAASEAWAIEVRLFVAGSDAGGDFKEAWSVPGGATGFHGIASQMRIDITAGTLPNVIDYRAADLATTINVGLITGTAHFGVHASVINSTTAGTVQFQWAQNSVNANATTVKAGSFMLAHRLTP